ncbi:post-transcriptional regulator [Virgibacillus sp. YIM 98842]|uniref:post-transcriptional regulator n=1 Tax=Virgibacillus sp. YIM 98842 TaxID=2663533 RepID=UPI0013DA074F|nr:post-transcriptional regulator [Virgibacillus sp. YIM 98842]
MEVKQRVSGWKETVQPALESKVSELHLMGYPKATKEEIWNCLEQKVWKGDPEKRIHEVIEDIFHLSATIYMNFLTLKVYQDSDLMDSISAVMQGGTENIND